jgi:putative oxidoreductase
LTTRSRYERLSPLTAILFLAGRLLFGALFLYNGVNHFRNYAAVRSYCAFKHVPMPGASAIVSGAWLLVSGASVVLGFLPEVGLVLIAVFLVVVTPVMHDFWNVADPTHRLGEMINFHKNAALLGATLMLLSLPRPWPYSF